jgi:hypothetical protein
MVGLELGLLLVLDIGIGYGSVKFMVRDFTSIRPNARVRILVSIELFLESELELGLVLLLGLGLCLVLW